MSEIKGVFFLFLNPILTENEAAFQEAMQLLYVFTIKPVYVFDHFLVPYVFISSSHFDENFSWFFLGKYGIYAVRFVTLFNFYEMCIIQKLSLA